MWTGDGMRTGERALAAAHDGAGANLCGSRLPRGLGWLSLGVGIPLLARPDAIGRLVGLPDAVPVRRALRAVGVQELGSAAALLLSRRPAGWTWTRVAGDVWHLALLAAAVRRTRHPRTVRAIATLAGVAVVDLVTAVRTSRAARAQGRMIRAQAAVTVNRSAAEAYRFWRDLENLPRFMNHLLAVRATGSGHSHWTAKGPAGKHVEWTAEITDERPYELIAWRSLPGARVPNAGSVRFTPAPGDRGTEVRVELIYAPPAGRLGRAVAKLFGEEPAQQVRDDLRRFKQVIETGEVVRSEGSPDGTSVRQQVRQRPARPLASTVGG